MMEDIKIEYLSGNGSFDSDECLELLRECDIVVTNPPFSLFRPYMDTLIEYDKKFIIIGNMNAITYKEIFPLIKNNELWAGFKCFGGGMDMIQTEDTFDKTKTKSFKVNERGEIIKNIMGCIWFTNVDHKKRHEERHIDGEFEIIGKAKNGVGSEKYDLFKPIIDGKYQYARILLRKKYV